jgi:hypothetical protein
MQWVKIHRICIRYFISTTPINPLATSATEGTIPELEDARCLQLFVADGTVVFNLPVMMCGLGFHGDLPGQGIQNKVFINQIQVSDTGFIGRIHTSGHNGGIGHLGDLCGNVLGSHIQGRIKFHIATEVQVFNAV